MSSQSNDMGNLPIVYAGMQVACCLLKNLSVSIAVISLPDSMFL